MATLGMSVEAVQAHAAALRHQHDGLREGLSAALMHIDFLDSNVPGPGGRISEPAELFQLSMAKALLALDEIATWAQVVASEQMQVSAAHDND